MKITHSRLKYITLTGILCFATACNKTMEEYAINGGESIPALAALSTTTTTIRANPTSLKISPGSVISKGTQTGIKATITPNNKKATGTNTGANLSIEKTKVQ